MTEVSKKYRRVKGWGVLRGMRHRTLKLYPTMSEALNAASLLNALHPTPPARVVEMCELRAGEAVVKERGKR